MLDMARIEAFAAANGLWVVEDAAHAFPAAWRPTAEAAVAALRREARRPSRCFSFYANKTITTGEGGMATTADAALAERMRLMSLHGLSQDAWDRYSGGREVGLSDRRAGLQVQPDRRRRGDRNPSAARAPRRCASSARPSRARYFEALRGRRRARAAGRGRRTGSTPGTCFRSACGSTGSRSIATPSSTSSRRPASAAPCTGGRCTCIRTTRRRSAGGPTICPSRPGRGSAWSACRSFPGMRDDEIDHVVETVRGLCQKNRRMVQAAARARS